MAAARMLADASLEAAAELGGSPAGLAYSARAIAALAIGDVEVARDASDAAAPHMSGFVAIAAMQRVYSSLAAWRAEIWSRHANAPTRLSRRPTAGIRRWR